MRWLQDEDIWPAGLAQRRLPLLLHFPTALNRRAICAKTSGTQWYCVETVEGSARRKPERSSEPGGGASPRTGESELADPRLEPTNRFTSKDRDGGMTDCFDICVYCNGDWVLKSSKLHADGSAIICTFLVSALWNDSPLGVSGPPLHGLRNHGCVR